jgi:hypothetical protein
MVAVGVRIRVTNGTCGFCGGSGVDSHVAHRVVDFL